MGDADARPPRWRSVERRLLALSGRVDRGIGLARGSCERLPWYLALLVGATAAWILVWAWYGVMILGKAFPASPGSHPDLNGYWIPTWWVLFPVTTILIFRRHAWFPILALGVAGWEDVLFYWVQCAAVPPTLEYLPRTPTADALYLRAGLFLVAGVAGTVVARGPTTRIRFVPPEIVMLAAGILGGFWIFVPSIPAYVGLRLLVRRLARRSEGRDHSDTSDRDRQ